MDFFCLRQIGLARLVLFACVALGASVEDIRTMRVCRWPLLALIPALVLIPGGNADGGWTIAIAGRIAGTLLALVSFTSARVISKKGLGLADAWMACAIGALGGPPIFVRATITAIVLMLPAKPGRRYPFIPALVTGTIFSVFTPPFFGHA